MFDPFPLIEPPAIAHQRLAVLVYSVLLVTGFAASLTLGARLVQRPPAWKRLADIVRARAWSSWDSGLLVLMLINGQIVLLILHRLITHVSPFFWFGLNTVAFHIAGLILVAGIVGRSGNSWTGGFGFPSGMRPALGDMRTAVLVYLATLPILAFSSLAYDLLLSSMNYSATAQEIVSILDLFPAGWKHTCIIAIAVTVAPVFEEVLFRGILLPAMARRWGTGAAIFLTSFLFALVHFHIPSLVPLFVIATAFAVGYVYSGSLLVPIVMHALFNAVNLAALTNI